MRAANLLLLPLLFLIPTSTAQAAGHEHAHDFDYLVGDWEFTGKNQQYGTIGGTWSAARVGAAGQLIIDEYKVLGRNGEVYYDVVTVRAYDALRDSWDLVSLSPGTGLKDVGTGTRQGAEVRLEQTFRGADGRPATLRIRYHDIGPDRFLWSADRSVDGGKTWTIGYQELEARRVGPGRTLDSLMGAPR